MPTFSDFPARRLGQVMGIPILIDVTFALAVLSVAIGVLRWTLPAYSDYALVFVLVVAGIFLSVLLHELGHAFAAQRAGMGAREIRIGGFYGLAILSGRAPTRASAIGVLIAGPLANAALFAVLWLLLGMPSLSEHLYFGEPAYETFVSTATPAFRRSMQWLAYVNFGMMIFNLLPAFPLDGGRIARLLFARVVPDSSAVRIVAGLGVVIGVWATFGAFMFPALLVVVPLLVVANYAIWTGEIAPPAD